MDLILDSNHYTPAEVKKLNYCRLYVGMVTISDCAMPCGTMIDKDKTHGTTPTPVSSWSAHLTAHQAKPSITEWRLWKQACLLYSDKALRRMHSEIGCGCVRKRKENMPNTGDLPSTKDFHDMNRSIRKAELPPQATPV